MSTGSPNTTLTRLAQHLESEQATITERWLSSVRRDPSVQSANQLTHAQLLDHLPQLFAELCQYLRERDPEHLHAVVTRDARKHGEHRWREGYRLDELLRELDILRRALVATTLTQFGQTEPQFQGGAEITARNLVEDFFSEVTCGSAKQFMNEQQSLTAHYMKQLEDTNHSLQRIISQRQRLMSVIAHELKNFLQVLDASFSLSEREPNDEIRTIAHGYIRDMHDLSRQLSEHASAIDESSRSNSESYDAALLCQELASAYGPAAQAKKLRFVTSGLEQTLEVTGDRLRTKQIISNLLSNAIKYTGAGVVSLQCQALDDDSWSVIVGDTGPGLTAQASARMHSGLGGFEAELPRNGIGLAIAKDLVDALGGSIHVVSTLGEGSRFEVVLPRRV